MFARLASCIDVITAEAGIQIITIVDSGSRPEWHGSAAAEIVRSSRLQPAVKRRAKYFLMVAVAYFAEAATKAKPATAKQRDSSLCSE